MISALEELHELNLVHGSLGEDAILVGRNGKVTFTNYFNVHPWWKDNKVCLGRSDSSNHAHNFNSVSDLRSQLSVASTRRDDFVRLAETLIRVWSVTYSKLRPADDSTDKWKRFKKHQVPSIKASKKSDEETIFEKLLIEFFEAAIAFRSDERPHYAIWANKFASRTNLQ